MKKKLPGKRWSEKVTKKVTEKVGEKVVGKVTEKVGEKVVGKVTEKRKSRTSPFPSFPLADIFFKTGLIEAWGRGTIKITDECKKAGLPEPEFKEEFGGFSVYFYKDIYTEENLRKKGLNERQIKTVLYVKEKGRITNKKYQELTGCFRNTARMT